MRLRRAGRVSGVLNRTAQVGKGYGMRHSPTAIALVAAICAFFTSPVPAAVIDGIVRVCCQFLRRWSQAMQPMRSMRPASPAGSLLTHGNQQFAAYFDGKSYCIIVARRMHGITTWQLFNTGLTPNDVTDCHDALSFGVDGKGFMHISWGMHAEPLKYAKSVLTVTGSAHISFRETLGTLPGQTTNLKSFAPVTGSGVLTFQIAMICSCSIAAVTREADRNSSAAITRPPANGHRLRPREVAHLGSAL